MYYEMHYFLSSICKVGLKSMAIELLVKFLAIKYKRLRTKGNSSYKNSIFSLLSTINHIELVVLNLRTLI